jgi:hypothetical protein
MRKTNLQEADSFTDRLKSEIKSQAGKMGIYNKGTEGVMAINNVVQSLGEDENQLDEKWSEKYKKSIDCKNPKGFSQKAHCQGKKKKSEAKEATGSGASGAFVGPVGFDPDSDFVKRSFDEKPKKIEATEATGSGSVGAYDAPGFEDVKMKGNHERGSGRSYKNTQIPGGKFVQVKKKCKKFPYCNQGDIKALKIWENKMLQKVITDISKKQNISESIIKNIIAYELGLI